MFCVKILFCKHYFSPLNTFMRKEHTGYPLSYIQYELPTFAERNSGTALKGRLKHVSDHLKKKADINYGWYNVILVLPSTVLVPEPGLY
jgi:hypothetical protein